jgi:hypothetical protein
MSVEHSGLFNTRNFDQALDTPEYLTGLHNSFVLIFMHYRDFYSHKVKSRLMPRGEL